MFVNFSNHPSVTWDDIQLKEAAAYGEIVDIPFPNISSSLNSSEILVIASEYVNKILNMTSVKDAVMVQGEFTLTFAVVDALLKNNRIVLSACSERIVTETTDDGNYKKTVKFSFERFREYRLLT